MSKLDDLIDQIDDPGLRDRIMKEARAVEKRRRFGLVFEEHLPECTPLYDVPVKVGSLVAKRTGDVSEDYIVTAIHDDTAVCRAKGSKEDDNPVEFKLDEIVSVAQFGEPIYPYLKKIDSVENAPGDPLWHTLIEADNYHALQLLEYLYTGKVDCIYIDPPYNTGAKDWKYNNNYVDNSDAYRHSKWLSFMEKRLKLAKKLLNPRDSVLIVTIDEKEYLHLGCLLEQMFPEARIQMISSLINAGGVARDKQFSRTDEYIYIIEFGNASPCALALSDEWTTKADKRTEKISWRALSRSGSNSTRQHSPGCFYPIFVSKDGTHIVKVGDALPKNADRNSVIAPPNSVAIWPLHSDDEEGCWQMSPEKLKMAVNNGYVHLGRFTKNSMAISYLNRKEIEKLHSDGVSIIGKNIDGSLMIDDSNFVRTSIPGTQWRINSHNALIGGTNILKSIFGQSYFSYPKSLYAVRDVLRFFVTHKPNALIIDFFAGSGTTLHAVNLLNAEDGGHRRCILVTNNEVSDSETKALIKAGHHPGDEEWEKLGIARHVTWPRTVCSIEGHDVNGKPLTGNYIGPDGQKDSGQPMANGFKANCIYFKLGFLDKDSVALGRQFRELLPILWMKSGAVGKCPELGADEKIPDIMILPENHMLILSAESKYETMVKALEEHPEIDSVYIVTNSESAYRDMVNGLNVDKTYQLYRDYLDNFRINTVSRR